MKCVASRVLALGEPRAVCILVALAAASLLFVGACASTKTVDALLCMTDEECRTGCETVCGDDPILTSQCDEARGVCLCNCDTSGSGGAGGAGGGGGGSGGGSGGASGDLCGADQECTANSPSICGTICIDPICGGDDNFDTAACQDGRCTCICLEGDCSEAP